jgi:GntR family transcriptional regulator, transcriptional repressor for pyruvate dehydrogenase complex
MADQTGTLADGAAESLRRRIVDGELKVGDRLPPERELVRELGVSRTVLREALSSLEALGMVESRSTRGRFVASGGPSERSRRIVAAWLHQHAQELLEVDEIRSVLEAHIVRWLSEWDALDASRQALAIVRAQEQAMERGDPVSAADDDAQFHRLLCSYTQNGALRVLAEGLIESSRHGALATYSLPVAAQRSIRQHFEIANALAAGDAARAAELARSHMVAAAGRDARGDESERGG